MKGLAGALGVAGGIATIGAGIKSAMTSGMDFTNALNTMQAVAGASADQVAKVGEVARQLGTDNQLAATSSVDAAQAMLELAKGGFTVEQSMSAARGTLQLAAAAQIEAAEAATIQSQALQAFGLQADQAGRVADVLANAANASSAEITEVAYALQQGGTVAKQFGLSVEDAATTIGLLANAGIQGSDAGTLMKSALLALTEPTEKQTFAMRQLGLWTEGAGFQFKGMGDLFAKLGAASKTMTRDQYNSATAVLFGSDAMRLAGVAATQGAAGWDKMRAAMGQSGSAAAVAAAKMQGLPGAWEKLKNAAQDAGLAFYDAVEGPLTSAANKASEVIGNLVTEAQDAGGDLGTALANPELQARLDRLFGDTKDTFTGLGSAAAGLVPSLAEIASSLAMASAAVGVGTWQILLTALRASTTVLDALNPLLSTTADLMENNQGAVTALVAGLVLFKTIPALVGRIAAAFTPMAAGAQRATVSMLALARANQAVVQAGAFGAVTMGRFGSQIAMLGQRAPVIARMQSSFLGAAASADRFGRTAGTVAAAGTGLRAAGAGIAGVFGGPVGLGLTAAAVGGMYVASQMAKAKQASEELATASRNLVTAQADVKKALTASGGAVTDGVVQSQTAMLDQYMEKLKATANTHKSTWEAATSFSRTDNGPAEQAMATSAALSKLGMTNEQLSRAITGSGGAYADLQNRLRGMGSDGQQAATQIGQMRAEFAQQQSAARTITPGITELGNAIRTMSDSSASASDKLNALKASMDAMNPARNQAEATAQYGEAIRKVADAAQGIDASAFNGNELNAMSEAGATLSRTLTDLANKSAQFVTSGGDMRVVNQKNEQAFQQLATATGKSVAEIRALYQSLGGETVDMSVELRGSSDVMQRLGQVQAAFNKAGGKKSVEVASSEVTTDTEARLKEMGFTIARLPNGNVRIDANTEGAQAQLTLLTQNMSVINALRANPAVDLNTTTFNAKNDQARQALTQLDQMHVEGEAGLVIDQLLQGKEVSMQQLEILRNANVSPQARLLIDQLLQNAGIANTKLDAIARERTAQIRVQVLKEIDNNYQQPIGPAGPTVQGPGVPGAPNFNQPRADGAIVRYAAGGISDLEAYANGAGLRTMAKPTRADIYAGRGAGTIFAEEETGGEAYIPLAQGKRGRSTDILAAVAKMFGFDLLPQGVLPDSVSGLVGGVAGGALSKLLKAGGIDGVRRFAEGGITTGAALRALAEGRGASRPLTGAPYVFGGVNWGDCSGAMSAFARLAAGLDPFGGRFATANEGEYLAKLGAKSGLKSGTMQFGWYNGGPGGGHTAGTLPDGTNVEMGGGNGGGMLGGSVGASDPQFTNHAYMEVKDSGRYDGGGTDSPTGTGGQQTNPDAAYSSGYTFDPLSSDDTSSGDTSISGSVGSAFGAFITGQLQDVFSVLSMNDQPGWLAAIVEYEKQHSEDAKKNYDAEKKKLDEDFKQAEDQRKADYDAAKSAIDQDYQSQLISSAERDNRLLALKNGYETDELGHRHDYENSVIRMGQKYGQVDQDSVGSLSLKQRYEDEQLKRSQGLQGDQYAREARFNREKQSLESLRDSKSISQDEYQRRLGVLKSQYDNDIRGMRTRYNQGDAIAKTTFDQQQSIYAPKDRYNPSGVTTEQYHPSDPGTNSRGNAGDPDTSISGRVTSTGNQIKDAFKSGLREAWRDGQPWTDTDWIITKESNWNPTATNPSSGAFGLPQFLGATKDKYLPDSSPDPKVQGSAYDRYVGDRYQTPMGARAHWEANNWYDSGGVGIGTGLMAKNVLRPERVLSPRQTEAFEQMVNRNFQSGIGTDQIIAKLDQLIAAVAKAGAGGVSVGSINGVSPEAARRAVQDIQRRQMMRASQ